MVCWYFKTKGYGCRIQARGEKQQVPWQINICLIEFYIYPREADWANCYPYPAVLGIHLRELKNSKGTLLVTDEGGEHLSFTPPRCSRSPIQSGHSRTLFYPLGYSLFWGLALPWAFSPHPLQLLCLLGLQPLCFQGTGKRTKRHTSMTWQ